MPQLSFGETVVLTCKTVQLEHKAKNLPFGWPQIAELVNTLDKARVPKKPKAPPHNFTPPTPEEVTAYSAEIGYPMIGAKWCDTYAAKGWAVGKAKMKDWKAAVRTWKWNDYGKDGFMVKPGTATGGKNYGSL